MNLSDAASLPAGGGERDEPPTLDALRLALRPPSLPLPSPDGVLGAASRAHDLLHAERREEAEALIERFRRRSAPPETRLLLLRVSLRAAHLAGSAERARQDAAEIVSLLRRSGRPAQAAATVEVLLERGPARTDARSAPATGSAPAAGRHRGERAEIPAPVLAVVRGLELTSLAPEGLPEGGDLRRALARLRAALRALPAARDQLLGDPEPELRLRLAQTLAGAGDHRAATTTALDLLELLEAGPTGEEPGGAAPDPLRIVPSAHAVLARTLGTERPLLAAGHSLSALRLMEEVDDPPLRIGLITDLLVALMAAGATAQASFTAGRLASLQRTLPSDALRTGPLLAVAAQRVQAERYEAARVPLEQARRIARERRDHRAALEVARLAASIHERTGEHAASLRELRRLASEARWLADDLGTPAAERVPLLETELSANALALRRALDLGDRTQVEIAAAGVLRRAREGGGGHLLRPELLWDHVVDARVGLFLATGHALAESGPEGDAADATAYEERRQEALRALDAMPAGHDARARYWGAYLEDRHAHLLAERGEAGRARRAARRARDGWAHLGRDEDVARVEQLLAALGPEDPAR